MFNKYDLKKEVLKQSSIVSAKKNNLWSILYDTYAERLNNYGKFPEALSREFDSEISKLVELINNIEN